MSPYTWYRERVLSHLSFLVKYFCLRNGKNIELLTALKRLKVNIWRDQQGLNSL